MADTKEKQIFLRKEIIDVGYDPTHFTEFLCDLRSDGDDVDNWSVDSLEGAVRKYQKNNPLKSPEASDSEEEPQAQPAPKFASDSEKASKKKKDKKKKKKVVDSSEDESDDSSKEVVKISKLKKKKSKRVKTPVPSESEEEVKENKKTPVDSDSEAETVKTTKTKKAKKDKKSKKDKKDKKAKKEKKDKKKKKKAEEKEKAKQSLSVKAQQYKESKTEFLDVVKSDQILVPTELAKKRYRIIVSE